jgi:PBP1b-binding outer membrane lipoprotein LpoB
MKKILIIILSLILIAGCTDNSSISPDNEAEDALNDNQETEDTLNDNQETENSNEPIMVPDFELETLDGSVIKLSEITFKISWLFIFAFNCFLFIRKTCRTGIIDG